MKYDGTTPLAPAVAEIIGCSPKNQTKIAEVMKQAKLDLNIITKARNLPAEIRVQIYNHLVDKYSQPVETNSQESVDINTQDVETVTQDNVEVIAQPVEIETQDTVETNTQPVETNSRDDVEKYSQPVEIIKQVLDVTLQNNVITDVSVRSESVKINSQVDKLFSHTNNFDNVRIGFYVLHNGKRERKVIAIDGYFINALATIGILKKDVPQWVQSAVDSWTPFDRKLPITQQVKHLIVRGVVTGLGGDDSVFYEK